LRRQSNAAPADRSAGYSINVVSGTDATANDSRPVIWTSRRGTTAAHEHADLQVGAGATIHRRSGSTASIKPIRDDAGGSKDALVEAVVQRVKRFNAVDDSDADGSDADDRFDAGDGQSHRTTRDLANTGTRFGSSVGRPGCGDAGDFEVRSVGHRHADAEGTDGDRRSTNARHAKACPDDDDGP